MPDSSAPPPPPGHRRPSPTGREPDSSAPEVPANRSPVAPSRNRSGLALAGVALLAVVAVGLSTWTLLRPAQGGSDAASYSDAQRTDAKAKICSAFTTVRTSVARNTNLVPPGGQGDVTGTLAVAANARISLFDGGQYLLARVDPATPSELADAVRGFANGLMDIGAAATAGQQNTDPDQAQRLKAADASSTKISQLCA